ncbi:MAG: hypothetical protein CL917_13335 [Deltaproteobacteria bacterium]|nr:hypothetical protein [Deltaproteobacteria bacterium]
MFCLPSYLQRRFLRRLFMLGVSLGVFFLPSSVGAENVRVVSLNPSLTSILIALGSAEKIVGVDEYSARQMDSVASLPRVGGLFNPSVEGVLALDPDLVVLVPSVEQRGFRDRLVELGVRVEVFENITFDQVLENIARLGALTGQKKAAAERVAEILRVREAAFKKTAHQTPESVIVVLQRDPVFLVGGGNFIEEILTDLHVKNPASSFEESYPRVAREWVIAQAPDVVIDLSADSEDPLVFWSQWPSLPAVQKGQVIQMNADLVSMPGPYLDQAILSLAQVLYGAEVANEIRKGAKR